MDMVHVVHDRCDGNDDNNELEGEYSSELEESVWSIDSIAGNADLLVCINSYISIYCFYCSLCCSLSKRHTCFRDTLAFATHLLSPT
jgi:hypothetical protein